MSRNAGECSNDKKTRRLFTGEQKAEAVNMKQSGKPVSPVAQEMGLTESALRQWVKPAQIDEQPRIEGKLTSAEQPELAMLRREFKRVKMERDFLTAGASKKQRPSWQGKAPPLRANPCREGEFSNHFNVLCIESYSQW